MILSWSCPPAQALAAVSLKKMVIDVLLLLMGLGMGCAVLRTLHAFLGAADLSLVRHVVTQLLSLVAPPFSDEYGALLLQLFEHSRTAEALKTAPQSRTALLDLLHLMKGSPRAVALAAMLSEGA